MSRRAHCRTIEPPRLVESGPADPRLGQWGQMATSFADVIKNGGDALIWSLIRIELEETEDEDPELCESRGFMVRLPGAPVLTEVLIPCTRDRCRACRPWRVTFSTSCP